MVRTVAWQQEVRGFLLLLVFFCMFVVCMHGFLLDTLIFSYNPKTCSLVNWKFHFVYFSTLQQTLCSFVYNLVPVCWIFLLLFQTISSVSLTHTTHLIFISAVFFYRKFFILTHWTPSLIHHYVPRPSSFSPHQTLDTLHWTIATFSVRFL